MRLSAAKKCSSRQIDTNHDDSTTSRPDDRYVRRLLFRLVVKPALCAYVSLRREKKMEGGEGNVMKSRNFR